MVPSYNLALVICTVGGYAISGFGESDAISPEWDQSMVEVTYTADGKPLYSRIGGRGMTVTITLSQKSRAHLILAGMLEAQSGDGLGIHPPVILPLPFFMIDPSTGETITSLTTVFLDRPASPKGKTIGEVVYKVHLANPIVTPAVANVI